MVRSFGERERKTLNRSQLSLLERATQGFFSIFNLGWPTSNIFSRLLPSPISIESVLSKKASFLGIPDCFQDPWTFSIGQILTAPLLRFRALLRANVAHELRLADAMKNQLLNICIQNDSLYQIA